MRLVKKLECTGSVQDGDRSGRLQHSHTVKLMESIVTSIKNSPRSAFQINSDYKNHQLFGLCITSTIALTDCVLFIDFFTRLPRIQFCEDFLNMIRNDESFLDRIIWSNETMFNLNSQVNSHYSIYWDTKGS